MEIDSPILVKAKYWATSNDFDQQTNAEISGLLESKNMSEINDRFYKDLSFGTGGMRGIMGSGSCRINPYNIKKATKAFAIYLQDYFKNEQIKIAISYDSRNNSKNYAKNSAEILASLGIQVYIFHEMRPVPMLSYLVRQKNCHGGICITASHNPPEYNGFKVYWQTGGQITPPHDKAIVDIFNSIENYSFLHKSYDHYIDKKMIFEVGEKFDQDYFDQAAKLSLSDEGRDGFKIVYSPLHGTGIFAVPNLLHKFGFSLISIPQSQETPDGNFPTVKSPNPEDPLALVEAKKLAEEIDADLVLATDPDSDRIAFLSRDKNGSFCDFNGNDICVLLTDYILALSKDKLDQNGLVVTTIVTTPLHKLLAESYGVHCDETLTGFKWICQNIDDYETGKKTPKRHFICGAEESYGFLAGDFVRDKDGVSSCAIAAEMVAYYKNKGITLDQRLDEIYQVHGIYKDSLYNLVLPGQSGSQRIERIMEAFRETFPDKISNISLSKVLDYSNQKIFMRKKDLKNWELQTDQIEIPTSNVLQFYLEDGSRISLRPSGTEPKIKFYTSVKVPFTGNIAKDKKEAEIKLKNLVSNFVEMAKNIS